MKLSGQNVIEVVSLVAVVGVLVVVVFMYTQSGVTSTAKLSKLNTGGKAPVIATKPLSSRPTSSLAPIVAETAGSLSAKIQNISWSDIDNLLGKLTSNQLKTFSTLELKDLIDKANVLINKYNLKAQGIQTIDKVELNEATISKLLVVAVKTATIEGAPTVDSIDFMTSLGDAIVNEMCGDDCVATETEIGNLKEEFVTTIYEKAETIDEVMIESDTYKNIVEYMSESASASGRTAMPIKEAVLIPGVATVDVGAAKYNIACPTNCDKTISYVMDPNSNTVTFSGNGFVITPLSGASYNVVVNGNSKLVNGTDSETEIYSAAQTSSSQTVLPHHIR